MKLHRHHTLAAIALVLLGVLVSEYTRLHQASLEELHQKHSFGIVQLKSFSSLASIAFRYNIDSDDILAVANPDAVMERKPSGSTPIRIPVAAMRTSMHADQMRSLPPASVTFNDRTNTIVIAGEGTAITLREVSETLKKPQVLRQDKGVWLLGANMLVSRGATLTIAAPDVQTLHLRSDKQVVVHIRVEDARLLIHGVRVSSWDITTNKPDTNPDDNRAFIFAKNNSRMDIIQSDIAYLGTPVETEGASSRGVSWRITANRVGVYMVTGNVIGNTFHHNYYAIYTFGATGMHIAGNTLHDNDVYGIDPHDDSNNLLIEGNVAKFNGKHGIIISARCNYNVIRNNMSYGNKGHGIMVDRKSSYNLIEGNLVSNNIDGIIISDQSIQNIARYNAAWRNTNGITVRMGSEQNSIAGNTVASNQKGLNIVASENRIVNNRIMRNDLAISLKNGSNNAFVGNMFDGNTRTLFTENAEGNNVRHIPADKP